MSYDTVLLMLLCCRLRRGAACGNKRLPFIRTAYLAISLVHEHREQSLSHLVPTTRTSQVENSGRDLIVLLDPMITWQYPFIGVTLWDRLAQKSHIFQIAGTYVKVHLRVKRTSKT
jgi:hypothetical protein